jgi:hypothetical protein
VNTTGTDKSGTRRRSNDANAINASNTTYQLPILCRYWTSSGNCPWGEQCRYLHLTPDALSALQHTQNEEDRILKTNERSPYEYSNYDSDLLSENDTLLSESDEDNEEEEGHETATSTTAVDTPNGLLQSDGLVSRNNGELEQDAITRSTLSLPPPPPPTQRRQANTSNAGTSRATCRYWANSGRCRWIDRCRFQHDLETRGVNQYQQATIFFTDNASTDTDMYTNWCRQQFEGEEEEEENVLRATTIDTDVDSSNYENEEAGICGFTADQMMELLAQGMPPWDEDAWRIMEALTIYDDDNNYDIDLANSDDYSV